MFETITITKPDDWHLHAREKWVLGSVLPFSTAVFKRAIIMPNLIVPVVTLEKAIKYKKHILNNAPQGSNFEPLMTLYLTDKTTPAEIKAAKSSGIVFGCKLYPMGVTTNSDHGVTSIENIVPVLETMEEVGLVLQVHGEVSDSRVDMFDREKVFLDKVLSPLIDRFQKLKVVLEHITTKEGVEFVCQNTNTGGTITAHHLLENRNALFEGGLRPHNYCLPIHKREHDRVALLAAATSGNKKFFLGTDSAPHLASDKESSCGCAGCFTASNAMELYAHAFDSIGRIDALEQFASFNGADFYNLPRNEGSLTLERKECTVPKSLHVQTGEIIPFWAGKSITWSIVS